MDIKGIIFDVDGTLVDSNDAHAQAWLLALEEVGHPADPKEVRRAIGMGGDKVIPLFTGWSAEDADGKALGKRRGEIFEERYLPTLNAFHGARELVKRLHEQGLKLAVASSAQEKELGPLLDLVGIQEFLQEKTSSGDAKNSKPDPDIISVALNRLGLKADEVIMVGDTPYDMSAARKLAVGRMAFLSGGWSREELSEAQWIYKNPADLLEAMGDSPLSEVLVALR